MLGRIKIRYILPSLFFLLVAAAVLAVSIPAFLNTRHQLTDSASAKLEALLAARKMTLSGYLRSISEDAALLSDGFAMRTALKDFSAAYHQSGSGQELHRAYVSDNPFPAGQKHKLDQAGDGSAYSAVHARYHPWLRRYVDDRGYYDVFLIDRTGEVVYTTFKEADFATNLATGPWRDTDIAQLFRRVVSGGEKLVFSDFHAYSPSNNDPASFMASAIHDDDGQIIGALAFQMPVDRINQVMQVAAGMGETGETYLVGDDLLMRSNSRFSTDSTILKTKVESQTVRDALAGLSGLKLTEDYRGIPVYSAYTPLTFMGTQWAVLAEIDQSEIEVPVKYTAWVMMLIGVVVGVVATLAGGMAARSLTRPIGALTSAMGCLAQGDLTTHIPGHERRDELGEMAQALQVFKTNAVAMKQMERAQEDARIEAEAEKRHMTLSVAGRFEGDVMGVVGQVSVAATQMENSAQTMSEAASQTNSLAASVANAAQEASGNVQTVASAAEELSASIAEIARQVHQSAAVSRQAREDVARTNQLVDDLVLATSRIGDVAGLINGIASQTNLLALNATIEAARAGEAGKGFAVVAGEVKALANQTAQATDEIVSQIAAVQQGSQSVVAAIRDIEDVIGRVDQISGAIASAVEEQGMATQEIARNVQQAAAGTRDVSRIISSVSEAAVTTGSAARQVLSSAHDLSQNAQELNGSVTVFLDNIRQG